MTHTWCSLFPVLKDLCKTKFDRSKTANCSRSLAFFMLLALLSTTTAAKGAEPAYTADFSAGLEAYKKKDFKSAEDRFRKSIQGGNKSAAVWLYAGHTFLAMGKLDQAQKTYLQVIKSFNGSPEAKIAEAGLETIKAKVSPGSTASATTGSAGGGLSERISVVPPQMGHPPVSSVSISAIKSAVSNLPQHLRKKLDESGAAIVVSPNMIDKWPESIKDLPEDNDAPTLAELPGRIYGKDMYVYERPKARHSSSLKAARTPKEMQHTVLNECFQILDDIMNISKDPELRVQHQAEANSVPVSSQEKMATFLKEDDWGPRETCAELAAEMFGAGDEYSSDLNRCFPKTKLWLKKKLGL